MASTSSKRERYVVFSFSSVMSSPSRIRLSWISHTGVRQSSVSNIKISGYMVEPRAWLSMVKTTDKKPIVEVAIVFSQ